MSRSKTTIARGEDDRVGPQPISLAEYIRISQESCRHGQCCRDQGALVLAYQQYVGDPKAPWNKNQRRRRVSH